MPNVPQSDSYRSLLEFARQVFNRVCNTPGIKALVLALKKPADAPWTAPDIADYRGFEQRLASVAYAHYCNAGAAGSEAGAGEKRQYFDYLLALDAHTATIEIHEYGAEDRPLHSLLPDAWNTPRDLVMTPRRTGDQPVRSSTGAQLTLKVDPLHINTLALALAHMFSEDAQGWLVQARIPGPVRLGRGDVYAVVNLSVAGSGQVSAVAAGLAGRLPETIRVDLAPPGMYRVAKGIFYAETIESGSGSYGQALAGRVATACARAMLTNTPIEQTLPYALLVRGYDVHTPAVLAQAVWDRQLKGGLIPTSGGYASRPGSDDIHRFIADPVGFAGANVFSAESLGRSVRRLPAEGHAQLVKVGPRLYEVEPATSGSAANSVPAYFLGYEGANQDNAQPAYVDIPRQAPAGSLVFTGTLSGCSVVVTRLSPTMYRVYHDGRVNSSLLYDDVVCAVDYLDYQVPGTAEGLASVFMHYTQGDWQLVLQRQAYQRVGDHVWPMLRSNGSTVSVHGPEPRVLQRKQLEFTAYREQVHRQLRRLAGKFQLPVPAAIEGVYSGGAFSPEHPALAGWNALRSELYGRLDTDLQGVLAKRQSLHAERPGSGRKAFVDEQISRLNDTIDYYQGCFYTVLGEAQSVEKTWLWQQIKASGGLSAVLLSDDRSLQSAGRVPADRQADYLEQVLRQSAVLCEHFQQAGSRFERLVPQDIYLSRVGDPFGGRCYPLVRAMAVALAIGGETCADALVQKLFLAAADPTGGSATLFKYSLQTLHANLAAVQASSSTGTFTLPEVASRFKAAGSTTMFALNTRTHSMLLGCVGGAGVRRDYFYDPNLGVFAFDETERLFQALQQHLLEAGLAGLYAAYGSLSQPGFRLVEIDTRKMASVPLGYGLQVADLSRPDELADIVGQRQQVDPAVAAHVQLAEDLPMRRALAMLEAERWGARFHAASSRLMHEAGLDHRWFPVLDNTENHGEGRYRVQFIDSEDPGRTRWVNSEASAVAEFCRYIDTQMRRLRLPSGTAVSRNVTDAHVDGLNAGFAIKALIQWFADKKRQGPVPPFVSSERAALLKIHSYFTAVQMAQGAAQDAIRVLELARTALREDVLSSGESLKGVAALLARTNEDAGLVFAEVMIGLDIYELAYAENELQRAVHGTLLAFDSASLVTGVAGLTSGLMGASTASAVLGSATAILGGLSVGFVALAQAFGAVADDARAVGRYFQQVDSAYKARGYRYDDTRQVLVPLAGAVISRLDLVEGSLVFGSQYIYSTQSAWIGDLPQIDLDREHAIEVRSGIGYVDSRQPLAHSNARAIILPATPMSWIAHDYGLLPFATFRDDPGFEVIRRLESERFAYDFYVFPGEQIIRRIRQEYVPTTVDVILGPGPRHLLVPELPEALQGYLTYSLTGAGDAGDYLLELREGVSVRLVSGLPSEWLIDTRQLYSDELLFLAPQLQADGVSVRQYRLMAGGVLIELDPAHACCLRVLKHNREGHRLNCMTQTSEVESLDAAQWDAQDTRFEQHLQALARAHQLHGQYVQVENYQHQGRPVGRGFYDVSKARMLFTDSPHAVTRDAWLGAVTDKHAYFHSAQAGIAWRVDVASGQLRGQFHPQSRLHGAQAIRLWQEGDKVYLTLRQPPSGTPETELIYQIQGPEMALVRMKGDDHLLKQLALRSQYSAILSGYRHSPPGPTLDHLIESSLAPLVLVYGTDAEGVDHRYWLRTADSVLIKPNLEPPADHAGRQSASQQPRSAWPIPSDLVLAGSLTRSGGGEVFFFYSKAEQVLFRQVGPGAERLDANLPSARRVICPPLANLLQADGNLIAITADGRVARVDEWGRLHTEAVNPHWLKGQACWWEALDTVTDASATLAVFGVQATDGKQALAVWYHKGQLVVVAPSLQDKALQFLGFEADGSSARLFEPGSGRLYFQPPLPLEDRAKAFGAGTVLKAGVHLPAPREAVPSLRLKAVQQVEAGLQLTTRQGEIVVRTRSGQLQLTGVDEAWQYEAVEPGRRGQAYDAEWQQANLPDLSEALVALARRWRCTGVLTLQGTGRWFEAGSGLLVSAGGIPHADTLQFVGAGISNKDAYVYSPVAAALYHIDRNGTAQHVSRFGRVQRAGAVLLLQATGPGSIKPLKLRGVDSVVIGAGSHGDTFFFSKSAWAHYRTVVIEYTPQVQHLHRLSLPVDDPEKIAVSRHDDDLVLMDGAAQTLLVVRQAFHRQAGDLLIELPDPGFVVLLSQLVKSLLKHAGPRDGLLDSGTSRQWRRVASAVERSRGPSLAALGGAVE